MSVFYWERKLVLVVLHTCANIYYIKLPRNINQGIGVSTRYLDFRAFSSTVGKYYLVFEERIPQKFLIYVNFENKRWNIGKCFAEHVFVVLQRPQGSQIWVPHSKFNLYLSREPCYELLVYILKIIFSCPALKWTMTWGGFSCMLKKSWKDFLPKTVLVLLQ